MPDESFISGTPEAVEVIPEMQDTGYGANKPPGGYGGGAAATGRDGGSLSNSVQFQ